MSVSDLIERLQALPIGVPMDLPKIRTEIHAGFKRARTTAEREALLTIFKAVMDAAERQIKAQDLEEFNKLRRNLLLIQEAVMPDGNVDPQKLEDITRREVEAGRMASDDDFRKFAMAGVDVFTPPAEMQKPPHCREYVDVLQALAALQKDAQYVKPALLTRLRQKLTTIKLGVAVAKWRASPVGQALQKYTDLYVSDATILGSHSDNYKRKLIAELYDSVATIYGEESPFLKCRTTLAIYIDSYADWMVLALKPEEKLALGQDDPRNSPYISGELHRHIRYCAQYNGELANLSSKNKHMPDKELIAWANARSCAFQYLGTSKNIPLWCDDRRSSSQRGRSFNPWPFIEAA